MKHFHISIVVVTQLSKLVGLLAENSKFYCKLYLSRPPPKDRLINTLHRETYTYPPSLISMALGSSPHSAAQGPVTIQAGPQRPQLCSFHTVWLGACAPF